MIKKMTGREFEKMYVGRNLVVHCKTEELANEFLELADSFGYNWCDKKSYANINEYKDYGKDTCYNIYGGSFCDKFYYRNIGYTIVEFQSIEKMYVISNPNRFFTTYTAFFYQTNNQKFAVDYDYKVILEKGTIVEVVGSGQHECSGYSEIVVVRNPETGKIYLTQADGLELMKKEPVYPKGVKSVEVNGATTKVTLLNGQVGYSKCMENDVQDSLVGFSVAYAKAMTGMTAKELREHLPVVEKKEKLELYHACNIGSSVGVIGTPTVLQDCNGKELFIGDMVYVSCGDKDYGKSVVANDGIDFVMGIHGLCKAGGETRLGWKIQYAESYKLLKEGSQAGIKEIKVRIKK